MTDQFKQHYADEFVRASYQITCSCGKKSRIAWSNNQQKYICEDANWQFRTNANNDGLPLGWHCGIKGHYQASYK